VGCRNPHILGVGRRIKSCTEPLSKHADRIDHFWPRKLGCSGVPKSSVLEHPTSLLFGLRRSRIFITLTQPPAEYPLAATRLFRPQ